MQRHNFRRARPQLHALEPRTLLHAGLFHLDGMLDGLARAATGINTQATRNSPPRPPRILEPHRDNQVVVGSDVHMETAPMADPNPGDTHLASDFQILLANRRTPVWEARNVTGLEKVHIHLGDGRFIGPFAGRTSLRPNQTYILRVRHRDSSSDANTEWGPWATRTFRTTPAKPVRSRQGPVIQGWQVLRPHFNVSVAAQGFQLPVSIAFVPEPGGNPKDPIYYVAELYGTIKVVTRDGTVATYAENLLNFNPNGVFPGSGELGLTSIIVEPESGDLFASLLYAGARGEHHPTVLRLGSQDGGLSAATRTTILDVNSEVQGASHQISTITIGPDNTLYVHMGDGMVPASARNLNQFRGKILRLNPDGTAPSDNPFYNPSDGITATDYIFASGFRNPFGGAWRARDKALYTVENGPATDRFAKVVRGRDYGWNNTDASMRKHASYLWNPAVAPVNVVFVQPSTFGGSQFPRALQDHAFVTESGPTFAAGPQSRGKRVVALALDPAGRVTRAPIPLLRYAGKGRATAAALAAGPDGLYFSELYTDRSPNPTAPAARILRITYHGPGKLTATAKHASRP